MAAGRRTDGKQNQQRDGGKTSGHAVKNGCYFLVFSNMIEAEEYFGLLVPPDRSVTANSLVSLLIRGNMQEDAVPRSSCSHMTRGIKDTPVYRLNLLPVIGR